MKIATIVLLASVIVATYSRNVRRAKVVPRIRLEWVPHRERLLLEGQFKRYYRMSADAFDVLVQLLTPSLQRVATKLVCRTGSNPIEVVNMVQMTVSWLAGGSYHSIRVLTGVSTSAFYDILVEVMGAVPDHPRFRIAAPTHDRAAMKAAARTPSSEEVPDVSAFFSGHYLTYGINVQAMCDSSCKFIGYCFNSPGKVCDSVAFKKWQLSEDIANLTFDYYVVGDNAYLLAPSMFVPFTKPEKKTTAHSDYNFYISQLRIRIEMSFGLLVNKWQVFQRALAVDYVHTGLVIKTCMKLHSYCIDDRIRASNSPSNRSPEVDEYNALENCSYRATEADVSDQQHIKVKNGHILRQVVMEHIQDHNMSRPY